MAKLIKKRKKLKLNNFASLLFTISVLTYICTMVFVKSYNATLQNQLTDLQVKNKVQQEKNQTLKLEVEKMTNRANLVAIVNEEGLSYIEQNVVAIKD